MKVGFFPKTRSGVYSLVFLLILVLGVVFFFVAVNVFDQRGGDTFFSNLYLSIPMLTAWAAGMVSLVTGLRAIVKLKDRAIAVYITVILSFLTTIYGFASLMG